MLVEWTGMEQTMDIDIIYSDEALIVLNKPAGLPVLPDGWQEEAPYLVKMLEERYGKIWIVHRIDKTTSGVLLVARTAEAHRTLNMQFENHEVAKIYDALGNGIPTWTEKIARHPLRTDVGHRHRTIVDAAHGKPSETTFRVLERYQAVTLLEARPATGRTHQVRVHAAALGFPLLGDSRYGAPATDLIGRPALHAVSLTISHPDTHEPVTFTAPHPEDFTLALRLLTP